MTKTPRCPDCNYMFCDDDIYYNDLLSFPSESRDDGEETDVQCPACEGIFFVTLHVVNQWEISKESNQ